MPRRLPALVLCSALAWAMGCTGMDGSESIIDDNAEKSSALSNGDEGAGAPAGLPGRPDPAALDKDGDHALSRQEAQALPMMNDALFDFIDKNGDGYLTKDEAPPMPPPPHLM